MEIDLSSLNKAIDSLGQAIGRSKKTPEDELIRDGVIQRFEYTYELCIKMLKRVLEKMSANPSEIDGLTFKELLREGCEKGLLDQMDTWVIYRHQRNITAHTYNEDKAVSVYNTAVDFIDDARSLYDALAKKSHDKS